MSFCRLQHLAFRCFNFFGFYFCCLNLPVYPADMRGGVFLSYRIRFKRAKTAIMHGMKNYALSVSLDCAFSAVLTFLIFRAALAFTTLNNGVSLAVSILLSVACSVALTFFKIRKNKRLLIKSNRKKQLENILAEFEIMPDNELIGWFFELFKRLDFSPEIKKDRILTNSGCVCFFDYSGEITREKAAEILKKTKKSGKTVLFCGSVSDKARALFKVFSDNFFTAEPAELYEFMKKADFFYEPKILPFRKKQSVKENLKRVLKSNFTKKRAALFTACGLGALVFSRFVIFKKYYLVYSVICFLTAAVCLFFGKTEPNKNTELPLKKSA